MHDTDIEPTEKLEELCVLLSEQQIEIHKAFDADFEYNYITAISLQIQTNMQRCSRKYKNF